MATRQERVKFWMDKGYSSQLANTIATDEGVEAEAAAAPAPTIVKATNSNTHRDECGEVGETGEHGDLGENGRPVEEKKEEEPAAAEPNKAA